MSILLIHAEPDRVRVVVDSLAIELPSERRFETSKIFLSARHNVLFAGRGSMPLAFLVYSQATVESYDFDGVIARAPRFIGSAMQQIRQVAAAAHSTNVQEQQAEELLIAGYSARRQELCARIFSAAHEHDGSGTAVEGLASAPGGVDMSLYRHPLAVVDDAALRIMSQRLVARCNELLPASAGGALVLAELSRTSTTVRNLCTCSDAC